MHGHEFLEHISSRDFSTNPPGSQINDDATEIRRQRERIWSAAMTDEQRNERNKKRREASYRRRKDNTHNKENVPESPRVKDKAYHARKEARC
ncbi:hypothetical protein GQ55_2G294800 [Panicum hallii var. hallii]|uniref:Uncharacterized protein n=1 Tax=Panicum hallii var. hallii TaxID=1504633 RepID=A0A2T7ETN4_9POAL|nr:hypothetical protein GQ55_2G294800 [Panicum hallii var. hallii]